jgi:hypothetical protein
VINSKNKKISIIIFEKLVRECQWHPKKSMAACEKEEWVDCQNEKCGGDLAPGSLKN